MAIPECHSFLDSSSQFYESPFGKLRPRTNQDQSLIGMQFPAVKASADRKVCARSSGSDSPQVPRRGHYALTVPKPVFSDLLFDPIQRDVLLDQIAMGKALRSYGQITLGDLILSRRSFSAFPNGQFLSYEFRQSLGLNPWRSESTALSPLPHDWSENDEAPRYAIFVIFHLLVVIGASVAVPAFKLLRGDKSLKLHSLLLGLLPPRATSVFCGGTFEHSSSIDHDKLRRLSWAFQRFTQFISLILAGDPSYVSDGICATTLAPHVLFAWFQESYSKDS
ncbi:uncharacterized protein BT62DRAFT_919241 [Guyanagaster necrorhizus]|uniref:Uncharacterized protein n=1 Tax=Guyanagaster necrorhizus TaxID=856835 RepID=A0A9P8ATT2_9AGAR|nr:uncharacterized protein BT62DRAFT_919241 [Guyanagaster necrorhizus MCA 3950]KAG7447336.1 hypothetical protein BT62DRAFT_919241 [Guyanagaster necrorhizus MCA 3950]